MHAELREINNLINIITTRLTHVLDAKSANILDKGALVFVKDINNIPLCVGVFVSPTIAITVYHFSNEARIADGQEVHAVSCQDSDMLYVFEVVSGHEEYDISVLRLCHGQRAPAFFTINESDADYKPGRIVTILTTLIGPSSASAPMIGMGRVVIKRRDARKRFLYFMSEVWRGESDSALLIEDGKLIAMFLSTSAVADPREVHAIDATVDGRPGECRALILAAVTQFVQL